MTWREQTKRKGGKERLTREGFTLVLAIWDESTHIFLPMAWGFQICKNLLPLRMSIPVPRVSNFFYLTPLTPFGRKEGKVRHVVVAQWYRVGHRGTMPFYYLSLFTFFICRNYFCKIYFQPKRVFFAYLVVLYKGKNGYHTRHIKYSVFEKLIFFRNTKNVSF